MLTAGGGVAVHDGHEAWIKRLRKKLRDVEDVLAQLRQCKTALINDQKLRAEEQRLAEEREERRKSEATRRAQFNSAWKKQEPMYSRVTYQCSCCSSPDTRYTRPRTTRVVCVAHHADNSFYGGSRCTKEGLYSTLRCEEHDEEYKRSLSALRTVEDKYDSMSTTVYYIRQRSIHTLYQVTQDIADLTHYLSLADNITTLSEKLARLDGYCKCSRDLEPSSSHYYCKPKRQPRTAMQTCGLGASVGPSFRTSVSSWRALGRSYSGPSQWPRLRNQRPRQLRNTGRQRRIRTGKLPARRPRSLLLMTRAVVGWEPYL